LNYKTKNETVLLSIENAIATLTLNRPEAANGMSLDLGADLYEASRQVFYSDDAKVLVIKGAGPYFSCGGDLKYMQQNMEDLGPTVKQLADELHRGLILLYNLEIPIIVSVHGMAAGAGFSLAMLGDIVIAGKSAKFTSAYTAAGLSPDGSLTFSLPRIVGLRKAAEIIFTNKVIKSDEALELGLITQLVEDDELEKTVDVMAKKLASGASGAFGYARKLLMSSLGNTIQEQLEMEARGIAQNAKQYGKEGITAFFEKRKPDFG